MSGIVTATSFVPTVGQLSHRNVIINGDAKISQKLLHKVLLLLVDIMQLIVGM